jgi:hypothetical protein
MMTELENPSPSCVSGSFSVAWAEQVARWTVDAMAPGTVLVIGVECSILAKSLCDLGVLAYHLSASEMKPTLQHYDLAIAIDATVSGDIADVGQVIEDISAYSDDILFVICSLTEGTVHALSPEDWTVSFLKCGFVHDLTFEAPSLFPWAARFRRKALHTDALLAYYERYLCRLERENRIRRKINQEEHLALLRVESELVATQAQVKALRDNVHAWEKRWADLERGILWPWIQRLQKLRTQIMPPGSRREQWLERLFAKSAR